MQAMDLDIHQFDANPVNSDSDEEVDVDVNEHEVEVDVGHDLTPLAKLREDVKKNMAFLSLTTPPDSSPLILSELRRVSRGCTYIAC